MIMSNIGQKTSIIELTNLIIFFGNPSAKISGLVSHQLLEYAGFYIYYFDKFQIYLILEQFKIPDFE